MPPAGPPPQFYGAPVYGNPAPDTQQMDTQRMLQPQGLFQSPRPFQPQPWPGSGANGTLFAPPLPGGPDGTSSTLPTGMQPVPPGGPWQPERPGRRLRLPGGSPRLPGGPLGVAIVAAAIVLVVAVVAVMALHGSSSPTGTTAAGTTPSATGSASAPSATAQQQAAAQLSGLLSQSGTDRADVIDAVGNVRACGKNLGKDARIFTTAAGNRRSLLARLAGLPGRSALPAAMVSDLSGAWQASAQVDTDLAKWASKAASHCHKGNSNDPSLRASYGPDGQATADKQAFARLWNPLAKRYGLPTYQWERL